MSKVTMSSNDPCRKSDEMEVIETAYKTKSPVLILPEIEPGEAYSGIIVYRRGDISKPISIRVSVEILSEEVQ